MFNYVLDLKPYFSLFHAHFRALFSLWRNLFMVKVGTPKEGTTSVKSQLLSLTIFFVYRHNFQSHAIILGSQPPLGGSSLGVKMEPYMETLLQLKLFRRFGWACRLQAHLFFSYIHCRALVSIWQDNFVFEIGAQNEIITTVGVSP